MKEDNHTPAPMTKGEREDLQRLVRQREKALKGLAKQRSAELLADFENQMGQQYSFDQDEVWKQAMKIAESEHRKLNERIAERCEALGIPKRFAPSAGFYWNSRGENSVKERRVELRKMAQTQIEAIERKAISQIEMSSVEAQTQLAIAGLTSDAARVFVEALLPIEKLMPALSFAEVAGEAEPPVAEQLVSSNALRQRRFRERQAALRESNGNGVTAALQAPSNGEDD